ncbi:MAG: methylated-DNA--[protein]-cysteine S-methyltransferase [Pseudomonadota bacterium]
MNRQYQSIARALHYIADHWQDQPTLDHIAKAAGYSPWHLQRVFCDWVGVSPKDFLGFMTWQHAKEHLTHQLPVLDVTYGCGLSSASRLHDLTLKFSAMTPGEVKTQAAGLQIAYGWHDTPFGDALVMLGPHGLMGLAFCLDDGRSATFDDMTKRWKHAKFHEAKDTTAVFAEKIFTDPQKDEHPVVIQLHGTAFQIQVWQALLRIPVGKLTSYGMLAQNMGLPRKSARAVAGAVSRNPVSWLIPCHRVVRECGALGGYRWGLPRKTAMLQMEAHYA